MECDVQGWLHGQKEALDRLFKDERAFQTEGTSCAKVQNESAGVRGMVRR